LRLAGGDGAGALPLRARPGGLGLLRDRARLPRRGAVGVARADPAPVRIAGRLRRLGRAGPRRAGHAARADRRQPRRAAHAGGPAVARIAAPVRTCDFLALFNRLRGEHRGMLRCSIGPRFRAQPRRIAYDSPMTRLTLALLLLGLPAVADEAPPYGAVALE